MLKLAGKYKFYRVLSFSFVGDIYIKDRNINYSELHKINNEIEYTNRIVIDLNKLETGNKYYVEVNELYIMPFIYVISLKDFMKRGKMYAKILVYEDIPF